MANLAAISRTLARITERDMTDECIITGPSDEPAEFDPDTGLYTQPDPETTYEGRCRVFPMSTSEGRVVESGERPITLKTYRLAIPRDADAVAEGQTVEMTKSSDPMLVGARLYVLDVLFETHQPSRQVIAEYRHEAPEEGS